MPELPEVETIRRGLLKCIRGLKISEVKVFCGKSFPGPVETILGATVKDLRRFGKALVIDLNNEVSLICHLRMTGQMIYRGMKDFAGGHPSESFVEKLPNKQTRVEIEFEDGSKLFFNDQRKFGFMKPVPTEEVSKDKFIASLAPEPWQMTGQEFYERLQRHKGAPIKAVILDQKVICGLGNIYADEALFFAKIHPERKAGTISKKEAELLLEGAREVMERSIESGGSTMATYVKADGTRGDYLELFAKVFRREGKECERCGAEIVKIRVAGRGTHICPGCQSWDFLSERKSQRKKPSKVSKSRTCRDFETENI
ncbi:MAG: bifunctional DNA-formamidopyrimidine glycosylase/DNA-(apurinic or apyrimidinic site) lyase [Candidatus Saccharibacteria bacterium]|nr:bifunctional DNA-formamidopyrimidine glycosylase/DNA-(apurinic or apyrimidinic site) lyase [Candidatus Saccharibacteria bacterium]